MRLAILPLITAASAQLSANFYANSCPVAALTIKTQVQAAISQETRIAAKLLWLQVSDCFSSGCDGSFVLAKDYMRNEKEFQGGVAALRKMKSAVESICPGVVSVADIMALSARDAVVALGGPSWNVKLGRRDSLTSSPANPVFKHTTNLDEMIAAFSKLDFSPRELVALMGAHTIGYTSSADWNRTNIDPAFAEVLKASQAPYSLDATTPNFWDNSYYRNLVKQKGVMACHQALFDGGSSDAFVNAYVTNPLLWNSDFANAMIKLSEITPLTGSNGVIAKGIE